MPNKPNRPNRPAPTNPLPLPQGTPTEVQQFNKAVDANAPEWSLDLRREDGDGHLYADINYATLLSLLLIPMGIAINHGTVLTADVYRAGILRARLQTFAQPDGKETPSNASS